MPSSSAILRPLGDSAEPQVFSRGKRSLSISTTRWTPRCASRTAAAAPPGPAPMMTAVFRMGIGVTCFRRPGQGAGSRARVAQLTDPSAQFLGTPPARRHVRVTRDENGHVLQIASPIGAKLEVVPALLELTDGEPAEAVVGRRVHRIDAIAVDGDEHDVMAVVPVV